MAEIATIARPYARGRSSRLPARRPLRLSGEVAALAGVACRRRAAPVRRQPEGERVGSSSTSWPTCSAGRASSSAPLAQNLLRTVLENGRLAALPEIAAQYQALVNARSSVSDALVQSAFPIEPAQLAGVVTSLEQRFGRKLNATVQVRPSSSAASGWCVGDEVLDTSVSARLQQHEGRAHRLSEPHQENTMQLNPAEISELIKSRIEGLQASARHQEPGHRGLRHRRHRAACTACPT
jgi:F-type H+-transporting ATPase subunit delta